MERGKEMVLGRNEEEVGGTKGDSERKKEKKEEDAQGD